MHSFNRILALVILGLTVVNAIPVPASRAVLNGNAVSIPDTSAALKPDPQDYPSETSGVFDKHWPDNEIHDGELPQAQGPRGGSNRGKGKGKGKGKGPPVRRNPFDSA